MQLRIKELSKKNMTPQGHHVFTDDGDRNPCFSEHLSK
jgi:hypothetical protein